MERKYNITSGSVVVSMVFSINKVDAPNDPITVHAAVDVANEKVYFVGEQLEDIDYKDLEAEIINFLQPTLSEAPQLPADIFTRIEEMRRGRFEGQNVHDF